MSNGAAHTTATRISAMLIILVLMIAVVSGCGGGGSSTSSSTSIGDTTSSAQTPSSSQAASSAGGSKTSFAADADAICKRMNAELAKKTLPKLTLAVIARLSPGRALIEKAAVDELERLTAPATVKVTWEQFLVARRALANELVQFGRAAKRGDQKGVEKLTASKLSRHAQAKAAASKLGLKDCVTVG